LSVEYWTPSRARHARRRQVRTFVIPAERGPGHHLSSKIEGLEVGARRLLRAEVARGLGDVPSDVTALEVLGNINAMVAAIRSADEGEPITIELLLDLHRRLSPGPGSKRTEVVSVRSRTGLVAVTTTLAAQLHSGVHR